jgi:hypothetical protein
MNRLLFVLSLCAVQTVAVRIIGIEYMLFGGDYDDNGCKPSAGYIWCNETESCIPMNQLCLPEIPYISLNLTEHLAPAPEMSV